MPPVPIWFYIVIYMGKKAPICYPLPETEILVLGKA